MGSKTYNSKIHGFRGTRTNEGTASNFDFNAKEAFWILYSPYYIQGEQYKMDPP